MEEEIIRLSKLMAEQGICSRREADEYIERGWVFVDGERTTALGTKVSPSAQITLAPEAERSQKGLTTILLHKPLHYVSAQPEDGYEPAITLLTPDRRDPTDRGKACNPSRLPKLAVAGRLDINSTGLLVFTQDGRIAKQLIGENSPIEKEYVVVVEGRVTEGKLDQLRFGLSLDGKPLRRAQVTKIGDQRLRIVLQEGRKRQIRRMCELVELEVAALKRTRIGAVQLGRLPIGHWRLLRYNERF